MSAPRIADLGTYLTRILGWDQEVAVERALRSISAARAHHAALVLRGSEDLVPIARAIHERSVGTGLPFAVYDVRRVDDEPTVRAPAGFSDLADAVEAARRGTLCFRTRRPPLFARAAELITDADSVLMICSDGGARETSSPFLLRPGPIVVPDLAARAGDLDRVIAGFAADALARIGCPDTGFSAADHAWVREHAARTLGELEKATLRLTALRAAGGNVYEAARRIGMAGVSLSRWIGRRRLPGFGAGAPGRAPLRDQLGAP